MKKSFVSPLIIAIILLMVSMACVIPGMAGDPTATPAPTTAPKPTDAPKPTEVVKVEPTKEAQPVATKGPQLPKGTVTSLDDVKSATIQIQSQGTFIDPQVGAQVNVAGRGSGFIIDPSGIAVTNNHVVTGAALLKVWVGGDKNKVYNARVLGASECSDLAVIKIDGADFPSLQWHQDAPKVGLDVYAAGFPLGDPEYTLTKGIISKANADGKTSWASVGSVLEHDARINPGNSGGPLVDKEGKIVGINYAANDRNQYFAIARSEADTVLTELKGGNDVNSIGVNGQIVSSSELKISGIWVSSVKSGSPADKSGLKPGDIIVQLEGLVLGTDGTKADYCQILRSHKPTDTLTMNVLRWQTKQIMEGQLNGRQLAVTGTFGGTQSNQPTPSGSKTATIYDDSDVISMVVPTGWEYDGSSWDDVWNIGGKSYPFTAQTLTASPSVDGYNSDSWTTPGIFVATSRDWASIGGYANLLSGVSSFYKACTPKGNAQNYTDTIYEGQIMVYSNCGAKRTAALVMAIRPKKNPQAYLVLVEMKYGTEAELNVLDEILTNTEIYP
jgi:serine protease Do